jgi:pimeloyl-ACP methyl ester carboxylesterase
MARLPRVRNEALKTAGIRHPEEIAPQLAYELLSGAGRRAFADALHGLYEYRIRDRLPEIACPTLVVWGADDPLVPLRHAFEYEQLIPHARVVVFPRTGHVPQVERPERFNATLGAFLED